MRMKKRIAFAIHIILICVCLTACTSKEVMKNDNNVATNDENSVTTNDENSLVVESEDETEAFTAESDWTVMTYEDKKIDLSVCTFREFLKFMQDTGYPIKCDLIGDPIEINGNGWAPMTLLVDTMDGETREVVFDLMLYNPTTETITYGEAKIYEFECDLFNLKILPDNFKYGFCNGKIPAGPQSMVFSGNEQQGEEVLDSGRRIEYLFRYYSADRKLKEIHLDFGIMLE